MLITLLKPCLEATAEFGKLIDKKYLTNTACLPKANYITELQNALKRQKK